MKSPMGSDSFCAEQVSKRVAKAVVVVTAIADLPDKHCALYLLRYQIGRLDYLVRTTPRSDCQEGLVVFDSAVRMAWERINGRGMSDKEWKQARLPTRYGGLALRSGLTTADAAYFASRTMTFQRCMDIFPAFSMDGAVASEDPLTFAVERINGAIPDPSQRVALDPGSDSCPRQQQVMRKIYESEFAGLLQEVGPWTGAAPDCVHIIQLQAQDGSTT